MRKLHPPQVTISGETVCCDNHITKWVCIHIPVVWGVPWYGVQLAEIQAGIELLNTLAPHLPKHTRKRIIELVERAKGGLIVAAAETPGQENAAEARKTTTTAQQQTIEEGG